MKHYFLNRRLEQLIKNRVVDVDKQKINSFGVLVSEPFEKALVQKQMKAFIESFDIQHCSLKFLFYFSNQGTTKSHETIKINPFGRIDNASALEFLNYKFDVLLNFCKVNNLKTNYLIARSKAKFKIGFNGLDYRLFDLILQFHDFETMTQDIKIYLKAMGKI